MWHVQYSTSGLAVIPYSSSIAVDCASGMASTINCLSIALFLLSQTVNVMFGMSSTSDCTIVSVKSSIPTEFDTSVGEESIGFPLRSSISSSLLAPSFASCVASRIQKRLDSVIKSTVTMQRRIPLKL